MDKEEQSLLISLFVTILPLEKLTLPTDPD